jgi:sulfhydrogenase subunit beta (sulfur reductase)
MDNMKLPKEKVGDFLAKLGKEKFRVPQEIGGSSKFAPLNGESSVDFTLANTTVPLKSLFYPQTETLYRFEVGDTALKASNGAEEMIIMGVRPCDAKALTIVDKLFSWDPEDPYYLARREKATLIGLACQEPRTNCFCTSLGGGPASTDGLDILMTDLGDSFLFQVLTEKGEKICQEAGDILVKSDNGDVQAAEKLQNEAASKIVREIESDGIPEKLTQLWESEIWKKTSEPCLGCGTCTFLCPTCHCFDIQDEAEGIEGRRCRVWDSCMFKEYTIHTSGHNPRPTRRERTRNRINHKYSYFVDKFGVIACVGCGRCINLCPVNVDILNILSQVKEAL